MKKKRVALIAIVVITIISYFWLGKALAIINARLYTPPEGTLCAQVQTPAIHEATGVTYTFSDSCLPPGWEPDKTHQKTQNETDR